MTYSVAYSIGQRVRKRTGYGFEGPISGVNHKRDGTTNYTVELQIGCIADGMQHIFSEAQIELCGEAPDNSRRVMRPLADIIAHIRLVCANPAVDVTLIQTEDLLKLCDAAEGVWPNLPPAPEGDDPNQ